MKINNQPNYALHSTQIDFKYRIEWLCGEGGKK
jgi:hypothetical protein